MMKKVFVFFLCILSIFVLPYNFAANIHGSIYDLSFLKASNSIVEINTVPNQRFLAINGSYSFDVPDGNYTLSAYLKENGEVMAAFENISIENEGNYVLDLFLYPSIDETDELYLNMDFEIDEPEFEKKNYIGLPIILAILGLVVVFSFIFLKKREIVESKAKTNETLSSDLDSIVKVLEKNNGRMTQKEIRKSFPLSEAKISLMIAELEHLGKVRKIKQGRGNIIRLIR